MNKEKKLVPKRRFAGFTDAWEQRKFSDNIISVQTGTNLIGKFHKTGIPLLKMGNIQRGFFCTDKVEYLDVNEQLVKDNIAFYGDFLFNTRNTLELVGKGATWMGEDGKYAFNNNIARIVFSNVNTIFFNYLYNTRHMIRQVNSRAMGTTSVAAIYPLQLKTIEFKLPHQEEQIRIGALFLTLDNLITLHQRKLEKVKALKSAYLSEMFPTEGERKPKRRFDGFTDDWEQQKLGNCAEILTGGTPSTQIKRYWEPKEIPWMSSGEVNKRRLESTEDLISKEGFKNSNARWVREFSVLIALAGQGKTRGMVAINNIRLTTNQSIAAIIPNNTIHYEFVFQNLIKRYDGLRAISSGDGTRGGLNKQIIADISIQFPSIDEQKKVGNLFKILDNLITLHQRKIEKLQNMKKAYLNEMFI